MRSKTTQKIIASTPDEIRKSVREYANEQDKQRIHAKPSLYAYYFVLLKDIAKQYGYNLVLHGSLNRDLDLIAIPWTDNPHDPLDMINALSMQLKGSPLDEEEKALISTLPGRRRAYIINLNRGGYDGDAFIPDPQYYIDISVPIATAELERSEKLHKEEEVKAEQNAFHLVKALDLLDECHHYLKANPPDKSKMTYNKWESLIEETDYMREFNSEAEYERINGSEKLLQEYRELLKLADLALSTVRTEPTMDGSVLGAFNRRLFISRLVDFYDAYQKLRQPTP